MTFYKSLPICIIDAVFSIGVNYQSVVKEEPYVYMVKLLLCMVLHLDFSEKMSFYINEKDKAFFTIKDVEYSADDFDEIVKIIFFSYLCCFIKS